MSTQNHTTERPKVYSIFNKSGIMQEIKPVSLPMYCKLYYYGYGMEGAEACVISEPNAHGTQKAVWTNKNKHGFTSIDQYARPHSDKFGIGMYYDDDFKTITPEEAQKFIELAHIHEAEQAQKAIEEAEAEKLNIIALKKEFKHLTVNSENDHKTTKANLVLELKRCFKHVKFSVTKEYYSSYYIKWTDGPTEQEVNEIVQKFCNSVMSHCGDFRDTENTTFTTLYGGFKYVSVKREMSKELENIYSNFVEGLKNDDYFKHYPYEAENIAYRVFRRLTIPEGAKVEAVEQIENFSGSIDEGYRFRFSEQPKKQPSAKVDVTSGEVQIIDYSEKSFAVIGETKPIKDQLKELGGKFNFRLSCGAGWIFPKTKLEEVQNLFTNQTAQI